MLFRGTFIVSYTIALLCAHFEGFIKRASNYYIGYVAEQKKPYSELKKILQL